MTQSKKSDEYTIVLDELAKGIADDIDNQITIDLNHTYGTTTTYWAGDSVTDVVYSGSNDGTFTIDINDLTTDTIDISNLDGITVNTDYSWAYEDTRINTLEIENMCKEYPGLEKAYRNFKSVYDMVKQDYEGKKKAGEIDDDIPF
jgi:hypothetical protein